MPYRKVLKKTARKAGRYVKKLSGKAKKAYGSAQMHAANIRYAPLSATASQAKYAAKTGAKKTVKHVKKHKKAYAIAGAGAAVGYGVGRRRKRRSR